ncbi:hypothetical protein E1N52_04305 [Paraburkholderia guartelaensis]|uniref:Uncharacterized protein n=1 Tax=Paraburkholderia guartelaensis TaxID=2546446 RepID=A0A4R5LLD1_9BURK|nr:hypothetical protein [Paraburkholderia guartelaensis]TDG10572.1 hypothetical protein E1N52_04305 [Paraburkholderia guartelaensis]
MKKIWNMVGLLFFFLVTSALLAVTDEIIREHTDSFGAKIVFYAALIAATGMLWDVTKGVLTDELSVDVGRLVAMVVFGLGSIAFMRAGHPIVFGICAFACGCAGMSVLREIEKARAAAGKTKAQTAQKKLIEEIDAVISEAMQNEAEGQAQRKPASTVPTNAKKRTASSSQSTGLERMY